MIAILISLAAVLYLAMIGVTKEVLDPEFEYAIPEEVYFFACIWPIVLPVVAGQRLTRWVLPQRTR